MRVSTGGNLIVERLTRGVRVMRFVRPDLREHLDEATDTETSELFREIREVALADLPRGWTLVINLGLVDSIGAAFYRCLLDVRKVVQARRAQLMLCCLTPKHQEVFDLFRGPEVFTIVSTEAQASRDAQPPPIAVTGASSRRSF
jgi:anti-anti-sigma regulatory factor